ncbi:hypothetical protein GCM10011513_23740 [Franconibacter daqui]|uniref:hypothetical protein n=1 Tax=Franconibacter daqui TaxID=2047724 RepID=UPI001667048F|nr:hypothetical protein [Franconibacter daqui]GGD25478.1 hypothetical protein GCM10011513_23740 [Franconibacter daqui]
MAWVIIHFYDYLCGFARAIALRFTRAQTYSRWLFNKPVAKESLTKVTPLPAARRYAERHVKYSG